MQTLRSMYHSCIQWVCDHLWRIVDPQKQYLSVQFDVTNACNLRCIHCYHPHHKNSGALTFEQWLKVLDQYDALLKKLHMLPNITICGGEPISWPPLFDFINRIRNKFGECPIDLLSNGTILTEEIVQKLKAKKIHVQISVDGPDSSRHDIIRGKGSFDKMMQGCKLLRKYNVSFHHLAVLSSRTSESIEDFFKFALNTGASEMNFIRLIVEGQARDLCKTGQDAPLGGELLKKSMLNILKFSRLHDVTTATGGELWHLIDDKLGAPNNIGIAGFVVDYKGGFKVSSRASAVLGNVFEGDMGALFLKHPTMKRLRSNKIDICGGCEYFTRCRGNRNVSYGSFGHFFGPDTGCWHRGSFTETEAQA